VIRTRVGYAGGTTPNPTYTTLGDHTESLQVDFDPRTVSYRALLEHFWAAHDPASRPWSRQYRAAVFYANEAQRQAAEESRAALEGTVGRPIRTEILPLASFTRAEEYHQKYYLRHERALLRELAAAYPSDREMMDSTAAARINGYVAGHGTREGRAADLPRLGLSQGARQRLGERGGGER
jgi:methionine-S-sulfoxide reductase